NPGKTRDALEAEFKKIFNLKTVIWLKKGLYEDDHVFNGSLPGPDGLKDILTVATTNGHVDEHCRFVNPTTVVVAEVTEEEAKAGLIEKENRLRMDENVEILKNSTDQDGNKLNIVRIPAPTPLFSVVTSGDPLYDNYYGQYKNGFIFPIGDSVKVVAAASYNNFLITNKAILMPKYWKPGLPYSMKIKDQKAEEVLQQLFPGREIYTFDVMALNFGGGGIHCITQQEPRAR
ncbi:MAG: agmatine deiminase family protein, partial [Anaerolineales bacterium]